MQFTLCKRRLWQCTWRVSQRKLPRVSVVADSSGSSEDGASMMIKGTASHQVAIQNQSPKGPFVSSCQNSHSIFFLCFVRGLFSLPSNFCRLALHAGRRPALALQSELTNRKTATYAARYSPLGKSSRRTNPRHSHCGGSFLSLKCWDTG